MQAEKAKLEAQFKARTRSLELEHDSDEAKLEGQVKAKAMNDGRIKQLQKELGDFDKVNQECVRVGQNQDHTIKDPRASVNKLTPKVQEHEATIETLTKEKAELQKRKAELERKVTEVRVLDLGFRV